MVDGISNVILKAAGKEGMRLMKNIIQGCIIYMEELWNHGKKPRQY
jgi:hypothetical protein